MKSALLGLALLAVGCAETRSWAYSPAPRATGAPAVDSALVVPPLIDRRTNENSNRVLLYMIPLVPFGPMDCHTPEGVPMHIQSGAWKFTPTDDFARAIAQEIDAARIFREAFTDSRASAAPYVMTGELVSTDYEGKIISYCLSVYGPILWFIGFPSSTSANRIEIRLALVQPPSEQPIWTHTMKAEDSETHWIYAMKSDFRYDALLKREMPAMIESLRAAVAGRR